MKPQLGFLAWNLVLQAIVEACVAHSGGVVLRGVEDLNLSGEVARLHERKIPKSTTPLTAITNVSIFDGTSLSRRSTVVFASGLITAVIPLALAHVNGARIVDGKGGVLLPGLIDNHCHPGSIDDLESLAKHGVTTAVGMACLSYDICNALKGQTGLPSFISPGLAAIGTGSTHQFLLNTPTEDTLSSTTQVPQFVANVFGNHSTFLKMVAEADGPSQAILNDLVHYTHEAGHVTTTHASTYDAYNQAILSLTDSIQHVPQDGIITTNMAQKIFKQKQFVTPTLNVVQYIMRIPGSPANYSFENAARSTNILYQAGVPILAGTDSFVDPRNVVGPIPFGSSLHEELEYLVQAGLTPLDALRGATSLAAKYQGLPDRGSISVGLRADFILINGDPLTNISSIRNVKKVWIDGLEYGETMA